VLKILNFTLGIITIENNFSGSKCICHRFAVKREKHPQRHRQPIYLWDDATNPGPASLSALSMTLRELLEQGFEVAVVKDATARPKHPEWGYAYTAALINYAFLTHAVWITDQAVKAMEEGGE
jgi:hypothetical protein